MDYSLEPKSNQDFGGNAEMRLDSNGNSVSSKKANMLSWMAITCAFSIAGVLGIFTLNKHSDLPHKILDYFASSPITSDTYAKSFGHVKSGKDIELSFILKNRSSNIVKVVGYDSSCTCVQLSPEMQMPFQIKPSEIFPLKLLVKTDIKYGEILQKLQLYTDLPNHNRIVFAVSGSISKLNE